MTAGFVVTGTDTGVGKTVFAAALTAALDACYWKPIQCGLDGETDSQIVRRLCGLHSGHVIDEVYRLRTPASPHLSAAIDGVAIELARLTPPQCDRPLVIEGVGGLMVPLNHSTLLIDVLAHWRLPVILVARTRLGTINHSLLSLEALRSRDIPVHGIAFAGDAEDAVEQSIADIGATRRLGRLPQLDRLDAASLRHAFASNFRREDFAK